MFLKRQREKGLYPQIRDLQDAVKTKSCGVQIRSGRYSNVGTRVAYRNGNGCQGISCSFHRLERCGPNQPGRTEGGKKSQALEIVQFAQPRHLPVQREICTRGGRGSRTLLIDGRLIQSSEHQPTGRANAINLFPEAALQRWKHAQVFACGLRLSETMKSLVRGF